MGTRCLTVFETYEGKEIAVLYRQFDGYYEGHGKELAEFLSGMKIVNGIRGDEPEKFANGIACLAAQVVAHFKSGPAGFYLLAPGTRNVWEEYIYFVTGKTGDAEPTMRVDEYNGPASKFMEYVNNLP